MSGGPELARLKFRDALVQVGFSDQSALRIRTRQAFAQHLKLPRGIGRLAVIQFRPGREIIGIRFERMVGGNLGQRPFGFLEPASLVMNNPQLQLRTGHMRTASATSLQPFVSGDRIFVIRLPHIAVGHAGIVQGHIGIELLFVAHGKLRVVLGGIHPVLLLVIAVTQEKYELIQGGVLAVYQGLEALDGRRPILPDMLEFAGVKLRHCR